MPDAPLRSAFFHPPAPAVELRAFTHGLMPRTVPAMMQAFVDDWQRLGVDAWNGVPNRWRPDRDEPVGWWTLPVYLGDAFIASALGAPPGTCILQPNVHTSVQYLISAPEVWERGKHVVVAAGAFPSLLHSLLRWQDLLGLEVEVIPSTDEGWVDAARIGEAIRPGTALVALSHVGFTTGERLRDGVLRPIADTAHAHGALFLIDGYHATAQFPFSVEAIGADVYVGGLLKEGCGSSGNAYLYLRPGLDLTPRATGWFGDADPFGFGPEPAPHADVRRRFLGGTTAIAPLYHSVEGLRVLLDYGLANVEAHVSALGAEAIQQADRLSLRVVTPREAERRGALVVLEVPQAHRMAEHLKAHGVFVDSRQDRLLRLAPFVWNSSDEVVRAFSLIGEALRLGSYRRIVVPDLGPVT